MVRFHELKTEIPIAWFLAGLPREFVMTRLKEATQ